MDWKFVTEFHFGIDIVTDMGTAYCSRDLKMAWPIVYQLDIISRCKNRRRGHFLNQKSFRQFDVILIRFSVSLAKDKPVFEYPIIIRSALIHHKKLQAD